MRVMIRLSRQGRGQSLNAENLSRLEDVPRDYMDQILMRLRRAGLLSSLRGARGGFALAVPPSGISVGDIIRAVEGQLFDETCKKYSCGLRRNRRDARCRIRAVWAHLAQRVGDFLDGISLSHLLQGLGPLRRLKNSRCHDRA